MNVSKLFSFLLHPKCARRKHPMNALCHEWNVLVVILESLGVREEMRNTGILSSAPPSNSLRLNFNCVPFFIVECCGPTMLLVTWWWMCLTLTYFTASQNKALIFWCLITYKKCRTQFYILEIFNMIANPDFKQLRESMSTDNHNTLEDFYKF